MLENDERHQQLNWHSETDGHCAENEQIQRQNNRPNCVDDSRVIAGVLDKMIRHGIK